MGAKPVYPWKIKVLAEKCAFQPVWRAPEKHIGALKPPHIGAKNWS